MHFNVACVINKLWFSISNAEWRFATNATDFNRRRMKEQQNLASKFECLSWRRASRFDTSRILDPNIRRQLGRILEQGKCGLGDDKYLEVSFNQSMKAKSFSECWSMHDLKCFWKERWKIGREKRSLNPFNFTSHTITCHNYTHFTSHCTHVFFCLRALFQKIKPIRWI